MNKTDPKGYYAILAVAPNASAALIRAAYRQRAMELHPDRNRSANATAQFQLLGVAFNELSNPTLRARYDSMGTTTTAGAPSGAASTEQHEAIKCSVCQYTTAQPRYVIYWEVKSAIFVTHRSPVQGIFCPTCAEKKALRASLITWLAGWWGFPWGPIYSVHSIISNLIGGEKPPLVNARILTYQALVFAGNGHTSVAIAIATKAMAFAKKVPKSESQREKLLADCDSIIKLTPKGEPPPKLSNGWYLFRRPFYVQCGALLAVSVTIFFAMQNAGSVPEPSNVANIPTRPATPVSVPRVAPVRPVRPTYVRSQTAPNGAPWPVVASYVPKYKRRHSRGLSTVTVDNSQGDSDVFVQLVSMDEPRPTAARVFFIPAFGQFTASKLTKGNYELRYQDLGSGRTYRGDPFELEEIPIPGGTRYTEESLTLYKVLNGNTELAEIDDADFASGIDLADDTLTAG